MSGEKTEPPSPKRLKDARKKGQVCKSNDLAQAALFATATLVLSAGGKAYVSQLSDLMRQSFQPAMLTGELAFEAILHHLGSAFAKFLLLTAPLLGALVVVAAGVMYLQVQTLFSFDVIKPKFNKLNPISGFQNIFFKSSTYIEAVKNILKFVVVFFLVYKFIKASMHDVILTSRTSLFTSAAFAGDLMFGLMKKVGLVFTIIGAADFMMQKKQYMKGLKMSKYEVEKEYKQDEGDPHIKHQRKHFFEEMLNESAVEHVPQADAVVVNPTHLAIALKYDDKTMYAPRVTAKGREHLAKKILELAKKHNVPVMRNVPLAHSLYEIDVGRDIPEDMYEAVAEVLNWVYQLKSKES